MTEYEKMHNGMRYDCLTDELAQVQKHSHRLCERCNRLGVDDDGTAHDFEYGRTIKIGNDVWIASNVTICGGVSVGDGSVIGAGSVVTRDIPSGVLAAGNPCRAIRKITEKDSMHLRAKGKGL